ncbi:MAG: hypothetical protein C0403_11275 [Desulfobacterium sp.]|nr:hypothetical protein [Desulfobacterium sp.]
MKQIYKGTVEGNVIRLESPIKLPQGTSVLVSFSTIYQEKQDTIQQRQLHLLETGFHLGKKLYTHREDLYDRKAD